MCRCHANPRWRRQRAGRTRFGARTAGGRWNSLKRFGGWLISEGNRRCGQLQLRRRDRAAGGHPPDPGGGRRRSSGWDWSMPFRRAPSTSWPASRPRSSPTRPGGWRRCTNIAGTPMASVDSDRSAVDAAPVRRQRVPERDGNHQSRIPQTRAVPNGDCSLLACNPAPTLNDDGEGVAKLTDFVAPGASAADPVEPAGFRREADTSRPSGCTHCRWEAFTRVTPRSRP